MELNIHIIEAAILRAAFIIIGFTWSVMIVRNRENRGWVKAFGFGLMLLFIVMGVSAMR